MKRLKSDWDDLVEDVEAEIIEALGKNPQHFELVGDKALVFVVQSVKRHVHEVTIDGSWSR